MTEYVIVTYDNVLASPLAVPAWDPTRGHSPQLGLLREAMRFTYASEAWEKAQTTINLMRNNPAWPNVPELAVVTVEEAEMLTRISERMCNLVMGRRIG